MRFLTIAMVDDFLLWHHHLLCFSALRVFVVVRRLCAGGMVLGLKLLNTSTLQNDIDHT
jgi:hypothetical protein